MTMLASLLLDLTPEKQQAIFDLIKSARLINADLSFNADRRGLHTEMYTKIESIRVRALVDSIERIDSVG